MSGAQVLERQEPFKNKKVLIALAVGIVLFMPIPILLSNFIEEKTGMTEQRYLANLPQIARDDLMAEVKAQEARQLAHFKSLVGKSEEEIAGDATAAVYMTQIMMRDLMGPTKIIRFAPIEKAVTAPAAKNIGWDVRGNLIQWGARDYVNNFYEATISYRGEGWWKLERLNVPGSRGILRYGVAFKMPTEGVSFHDGMFEQRDEIPQNDPVPFTVK